MIDFSTLRSLTIPEGVVKQIADEDGTVLWTQPAPFIRFGIEGYPNVTYYKAAPGMTWRQWCASEYNTNGYKIVGSQVGKGTEGPFIGYESPQNVIKDGYIYTLVMPL